MKGHLVKVKYNELKAGDTLVAINNNDTCWNKGDKFKVYDVRGYKVINCKFDDTHYLDSWNDDDGYLIGLMKEMTSEEERNN